MVGEKIIVQGYFKPESEIKVSLASRQQAVLTAIAGPLGLLGTHMPAKIDKEKTLVIDVGSISFKAVDFNPETNEFTIDLIDYSQPIRELLNNSVIVPRYTHRGGEYVVCEMIGLEAKYLHDVVVRDFVSEAILPPTKNNTPLSRRQLTAALMYGIVIKVTIEEMDRYLCLDEETKMVRTVDSDGYYIGNGSCDIFEWIGSDGVITNIRPMYCRDIDVMCEK